MIINSYKVKYGENNLGKQTIALTPPPPTHTHTGIEGLGEGGVPWTRTILYPGGVLNTFVTDILFGTGYFKRILNPE